MPVKIGDAEVIVKGNQYEIKPNVTNDFARELGFQDGPFSIGYNTIDLEVTDVAVVLPPAIMRPRYKL